MTSIAPPNSSAPRHAALIDWLAALPGAPVLPTTLAAITADASMRRYFRVTLSSAGKAAPQMAADAPKTETRIVMDAPPPEKCREFAAVRALMAEAGLNVPEILACDFEHGFMLLSDLGGISYLDQLAPHAPAAALGEGTRQASQLMRDALGALIQWQLASRPGLLPLYDRALLQREVDLMPEWFLGQHLGLALGASEREGLEQTFTRLIDQSLAQPRVFVHRDFMPRNLMVATPNPGVLDFQDAVYGPLAYDVVSLLRDAFISWDEAFELDCLAWYWERAKAVGLPVAHDFAAFYRGVEWTGLQRHLKILGLFARISYRSGEPRYLGDTPRFLAYTRRVAVRYRELAPLARLVDRIEGRVAGAAYSF